MKNWFNIIPKNPTLSVYIWIIFCILPFFFIIQSFSFWQMILGATLIVLYFICNRFSFAAKNGLVYMWISFQMILNILMTLLFGYVYLSLFTAFFIGNIRQPVGFYIIYGLHIGFTILSIVAGFFINLHLFLSQSPFIIIAVVGVVLLPFTLYSRNKQENLVGQLETARERISELVVFEERQRIARDLHDTLGQKLSMIGLKSDLAMRLVEKNPEKAIAEIKDIRQTTTIALKEVRELVANMRAVRIPEEIMRVEQILNVAGISLEITGDVDAIKIPGLSESVVSMCLKEAVNNIVKHSKASKCHITFTQTDTEMKMIVQDNGVGFSKEIGRPTGNGLKGMNERLEFINGSLEINQNNGTELLVHVPIAITHQKGV